MDAVAALLDRAAAAVGLAGFDLWAFGPLPYALFAAFVAVMLVMTGFMRLQDQVAINRKIERVSGRRIAEKEIRLIENMSTERVNDTILRILPTLQGTKKRLRQAGVPIEIRLYVVLILFTGIGLALFIDTVFIPESIAGIEPILYSIEVHLFADYVVLRNLWERRRGKLVKQLAASSEYVARALRVGQSIEASIKSAAEAAEAPLHKELKTVSQLVDLGVPLENAMITVSRDLDVPEFLFFASAVRAQAESGGNLHHVLMNLADVIRQRNQMDLRVKAMTSEGKMTAYLLVALPILIFAYLHYGVGGYTNIMIETDIGRGLFGLSGVMIIIGFFVMMKMVKIRI